LTIELHHVDGQIAFIGGEHLEDGRIPLRAL
jgi:hypothetical protein